MAPNLLTNHLHQQRDRIAGMLMPGAKTAPGQRPLSPVLPGFGGQKFRLAARKMRALDPAQLGNLRPEKILQPLIGPVNEARNLLHLKPAAEENASTPWSQVETVFPSAAAEPEPPSGAGELRQGSIIPRMALFPKPGQSLESFKEQVQQRAKVPPSSAEPQKPQISPKSRLFSRVQEIATPKTPEEPSVDLPAEETIQRQPDFKRGPAPELPKKPVDVEKPTQAAEPLSLFAPLVEPKNARVDETPSQPPAPQPEAAPKTAVPATRDETTPLARAIPVQTQKSVHPASRDETAPLPRAILVQTQKSAHPASTDETAPLPSAIPVQTQKPVPPERTLPHVAPIRKQPPVAVPPTTPAQAQKPAVQAKPTGQKATPPSKPKITPNVKAPQTPASQPTPVDATPAPRAAPDLPTPMEEPPELELFTSPALPEATKPAPETGPVTVSEPETTPSGEMPLRKQATYHRQTPARLKALTPQHVKPRIVAPVLARLEKPLIPPQKYHPAAPAVVARQPDERPLSDFSRPAPTQEALEKPRPAMTPQAQRAEPEGSAQPASTSSTGPVPMALAYPPRQAEQVPPTPPPPPAVPTVTTPVETAPQKFTPPAVESRPASVQNVVQRKWPENEGGPSSGDSGGGQAAEQSGAGQAQPGFDLAQLAEDVFPYVKRLIEIESDRVSSRFR